MKSFPKEISSPDHSFRITVASHWHRDSARASPYFSAVASPGTQRQDPRLCRALSSPSVSSCYGRIRTYGTLETDTLLPFLPHYGIVRPKPTCLAAGFGIYLYSLVSFGDPTLHEEGSRRQQPNS
jgi:hypothetical protein